MWQSELSFPTQGRGFYRIDSKIEQSLREAEIAQGMCHLFLKHTSASLIITENADADVRRDLEALTQRLVPDGDPIFRHTLEGEDDMAAHARNVLTGASVSIPIINHQLGLGTWQGIYLWEHRFAPQRRQIIVTAW